MLFNLGRVDLSRLNFVQPKRFLIAALALSHSRSRLCLLSRSTSCIHAVVCKKRATMSRKRLGEPAGQRLFEFSTVLALIYGE